MFYAFATNDYAMISIYNDQFEEIKPTSFK